MFNSVFFIVICFWDGIFPGPNLPPFQGGQLGPDPILNLRYIVYCMIFQIKWWVFGDLDDGIGILDGDYVICNDFLLTERKYLVFLILHLV